MMRKSESMGKLRDWWPSPLSPSPSTPPSSSSSTFIGASMEAQDLILPKAQHLSRPSFKLTSSKELKEELLKQLHVHNSPSPPSASSSLPTLSSSSSSSMRAPMAQTKRSRGSRGSMKPCCGESPNTKPKEYSSSTLNEGSTLSKEDSVPRRESSEIPAAGPDDPKRMSRREVHIVSERERRKGMTHLYATLHSLLPDAKPKVDRCTVLTEAMDYILLLRARLEDLEQQKTEILMSLGEQYGCPLDNFGELGGDIHDGTSSSMENTLEILMMSEERREELLSVADVSVRFRGREDAFITLKSPKKKGVWSEILQILDDHDMEVLNVTLSRSDHDMDHHCVHARLSKNSEIRSPELQKILQELILRYSI